VNWHILELASPSGEAVEGWAFLDDSEHRGWRGGDPVGHANAWVRRQAEPGGSWELVPRYRLEWTGRRCLDLPPDGPLDIEGWVEQQPVLPLDLFRDAYEGLSEEAIAWFERHARRDPRTVARLAWLRAFGDACDDWDVEVLAAMQAAFFLHLPKRAPPPPELPDSVMELVVCQGSRQGCRDAAQPLACALLALARRHGDGDRGPVWARDLVLHRTPDWSRDRAADAMDAARIACEAVLVRAGLGSPGMGERRIILRDVPAGIDWGFVLPSEEGAAAWTWLAQGPPRMHLQVAGGIRHGRERVWLERDGRRVFEPEGSIPRRMLRTLRIAVLRCRDGIEADWVAHMIRKGWLRTEPRGAALRITAYPGTPAEFRREVDLGRVFAHPIPELRVHDVRLDPETASVRLWTGLPESMQELLGLPGVLWQPEEDVEPRAE
jgi:hypothetical protein